MKTATNNKVGRKQKHFIDPASGKPIVGLSRRPDGRWRIIGSHKTFRESDPLKAIERFRRLTTDGEAEADILDHLRRNRLHNRIGIDWSEVAKEINARPQWVAKQTGIEWIAYGTTLRPPEPLPSLKELEDAWQNHARCSVLQRKKVLRAWNDFKSTTSIVGVADITPQVVVGYKDAVYARQLSGKQQSHLFGGIRRLVRFCCKERAMAMDKLTTVIGYLEILKATDSTAHFNPKPIEIADWRSLLANAKGDDKAMVLLMLNGAFYIQEVIDLKWSHIRDGCIRTHRSKTGKCIRVATLWPETLEALTAVAQRGEHIFLNYRKEPLKAGGAFRRFAAVAEAASIAVTPSQLRDGAATAAAAANVTKQLIDLLLGHRSGIADHYVARNPKMVAPACEAVYRHYFG